MVGRRGREEQRVGEKSRQQSPDRSEWGEAQSEEWAALWVQGKGVEPARGAEREGRSARVFCFLSKAKCPTAQN